MRRIHSDSTEPYLILGNPRGVDMVLEYEMTDFRCEFVRQMMELPENIQRSVLRMTRRLQEDPANEGDNEQSDEEETNTNNGNN